MASTPPLNTSTTQIRVRPAARVEPKTWNGDPATFSLDMFGSFVRCSTSTVTLINPSTWAAANGLTYSDISGQWFYLYNDSADVMTLVNESGTVVNGGDSLFPNAVAMLSVTNGSSNSLRVIGGV